MDIFDDLKSGSIEYLFLEDLSALECQVVILEAKRKGFAVERVGCWTREKDYFCIHDYERFTEDYLNYLEGWELRAFEQLLGTYNRVVLRNNRNNLPKFELLITRGYDPMLAKIVSEDVNRLRSDPEYVPKDFEAYIAPVGISLE